jgi:SAM-dependent methyltransferase
MAMAQASQADAAAPAATEWDQVYADNRQSGGWAYLSDIVVGTLRRESMAEHGQSVIEVGSGSGLNSRRLAADGLQVTLLDLSLPALSGAADGFAQATVPGHFVNADLFHIPFADGAFDVVWNAGVIEHWVGDEQAAAVREMLRVCRVDGCVVTLNPYAGSLLHVTGKAVLSCFGKYPYTDERNIRSLADQAQLAGGTLARPEYSTGFFVLFVGALLMLTSLPLGGIFRLLFDICNYCLSAVERSPAGGILRAVDALLCRIFGGYLLVSVIRKEAS